MTIMSDAPQQICVEGEQAEYGQAPRDEQEIHSLAPGFRWLTSKMIGHKRSLRIDAALHKGKIKKRRSGSAELNAFVARLPSRS
jgi:hypothetical protein